MELALKVLFYLLWGAAGAIGGFFMRHVSANEKRTGHRKILLPIRILVLIAFVLLIGLAMEIAAIVKFEEGEMLPAGILCMAVCVTAYFARSRK